MTDNEQLKIQELEAAVDVLEHGLKCLNAKAHAHAIEEITERMHGLTIKYDEFIERHLS